MRTTRHDRNCLQRDCTSSSLCLHRRQLADLLVDFDALMKFAVESTCECTAEQLRERDCRDVCRRCTVLFKYHG